MIRCVAESKSGEANYTQNSSTYGGDVLIATQDQVDSVDDPEEGLMFFVWEDDDTTCEIMDDTDALDNTISAVDAFTAGKDAITNADCGTLCKIARAAKSAIKFIANASDVIKTNDDLIGEIIQRSCSKDGNTGDYEVRRDEGLNGCASLRAN